MEFALRVRKQFTAVAWATCLLALGVTPAIAHIVMGGSSLRLLTAQADVVARVQIIDALDELDAVYRDQAFRTRFVRARLLETWKGSLAEPGATIRFYQHGHGTVEYADEEEVLVFLRRTENIAELAGGPIVSQLEWVSEQETGAHYRLNDTNRKGFANAVASYIAMDEAPEALRSDMLRRITVEMLTSPYPELAQSAMGDLVLAGEQISLTSEDLTVLLPLIDDNQEGAAAPIGIRIGLLSELERRGLVAGPPRWAHLIETTTGRDQIAVIRAAAANPSNAVVEALIPLLKSDNLQIASTAAVALGNQKSPMATQSLVALLQSNESQLRMSAIRGLGRDGSSTAREALSTAASQHPDPATRRRALAELSALSPHSET